MAIKNSNAQRGNVMIIVLMGIVLFAALAFVVARGMRSETTTAMSQRQAELSAVDILDYAQRLERGVTKLRQKGVSESDLDFSNGFVSGYDHAAPQPDDHKIFNGAGGGVAYLNPASGVNDGSPWLFPGGTCIVNVGTGGAGCNSDGVNNEELLAVLPNVRQNICDEINKRLNIAAMPSGGTLSTSKFVGVFGDDSSPNGVDGLDSACITYGGNYYFYYVLLAR